jgi:RNA polymerase sigma-70 factor (ECF subfamily)
MDRNDNETMLLENIMAGDEHAFEIAFLKYYTPLCKYVWKYVRSEDTAQEIVQEVFAVVWETRAKLDPEGHLRGLLYQMARNKALNYLKHQKVVEGYKVQVRNGNENPYYELAESGDSEQKLFHAVQDAVEDLPPKARRIFRLNRQEGLTYREIAGYLDISIKTVESQMIRSLRLLRDALSEYAPLFILFIGLGLMTLFGC